MSEKPQRRDHLDELRAILKRIPNEPGVYRFLDAEGTGAVRGQGEGAAQARRELPAPVGAAPRAHGRDALAGRRHRLGGDGVRVRGAPARGQLHQGGAPALQPPPARRQELSVHRSHAERRVAARALLPRPPRAGQPVLRAVLERSQGTRHARADRPHLPVPQVPRPRAGPAQRFALPAVLHQAVAGSVRRPLHSRGVPGAPSVRPSTSCAAASVQSRRTSNARWRPPLGRRSSRRRRCCGTGSPPCVTCTSASRPGWTSAKRSTS